MFWMTLRLKHACFLSLALATTVMAQENDSGAPAATDAAESTAIVADVLDPAFDRYVDLTLLAPAVEQGDAGTLTDLALQAAFGESILERSHKAVTSKELASLALKVATDTKDDKSLDRLAKLAEKSGDNDLKTQVTMQRKLTSASRAAPALMVSLDQMSVDGLKDFKDYVADIELALRLGDRWKLEQIREADLSALPEELQAKISESIEAADEKLSQGSDALNKLLAVSRACTRQKPPPAPIGGGGSYGPPPGGSVVVTPPPTSGGSYSPPAGGGSYGPPTAGGGSYGPPTAGGGGLVVTGGSGGSYGPPTAGGGGLVVTGGSGGSYGPPTSSGGSYGPPTSSGGYGPPAGGGSGGSHGALGQLTGASRGSYGSGTSGSYGGGAGGSYGSGTSGSYGGGAGGSYGGGAGGSVVKYQRGPAYRTGSFTGTFEQTGPATWVERNSEGSYQCREVSRSGSVVELVRTGSQAGQRFKIDLARNEIVDYSAPSVSCKIVPPPPQPQPNTSVPYQPITPAPYQPTTPAPYQPIHWDPPPQPQPGPPPQGGPPAGFGGRGEDFQTRE